MALNLWFVILGLAYVAVLFGMSWYASTHDTSQQFVTARRSLSAFGIGASISVGWVDVAIFASVGLIAFEFGWASLWLAIGVGVGLYGLSLVAPKIKSVLDHNGHKTMVDYYAFRLNSNRFGLICGVIAVVCFALWSQSLFVIGGQMLADVTSFSFTQAVVLVGFITGVYLKLGGFHVVLKTDVFQFVLMFLMGIILLFPAEGITWQWGLYEAKSLFSPGWWWISSLFLTLAVGPFTWPDVWQRMIAAKSGAVAKKGLRLAVLGFGIPTLFLTIFAATVQFYGGTANPEGAVVHALQFYANPVLLPFIFVVIVAVLMSSLDTTIFGGSVFFLRDVITRIPRWQNTQLTRKNLQPILVIFIVFEVVMSHFFTDGFAYLFFGISATTCMAPAAIALCVDKYKVSEFAAFWSTLLSFIVFVIGVFMGFISPFDGIIPLSVASVFYIFLELFDKKIRKNPA